MTRRTRIAAVVALGAAIAVWLLSGVPGFGTRGEHAITPAHRTATPALADAIRKVQRSGALPGEPRAVRITGAVIDQLSHTGVGDVEVVFRGPLGESSTTAAADGTYAIDVLPGVYRAYVRSDDVLSVGVPDRERLPTGPRAEAVGLPDDALMPLIAATADVEHVELGVIHGGTISGRVVDRDGRPVARAIVRALGRHVRPVGGTDLVESDASGGFELRLPPGSYVLDASHPRFAGATHADPIELDAGDKVDLTVTLVAGCIVSGRVLRADGSPAGDGAIEEQFGETDNEFGPSGRVEADGAFRWATTEDGDVTLRAWPWKSPRSSSKRFACRDGARFADVVFELPELHTDLEGTLVDAHGAPVALAYLNVTPLDPSTPSLQERTDGEGHWAVYNTPAGQYQVTAQAPGRGVVVTTIVAPSRDVKLQLGGVGRIEGTARELDNGSFEVDFETCNGMAIAHEPRVVPVAGGRFAIDDAPACDLRMVARWHGETIKLHATVAADDTAHVEVAIGPPRTKTIHGTVRDRDARPVSGALVRAYPDRGDTITTTTDAAGRYSLAAFSGAMLMAAESDRYGYGAAGHANVADEEVDLVLDDDERH